jgi:hypothetical protein
MIAAFVGNGASVGSWCGPAAVQSRNNKMHHTAGYEVLTAVDTNVAIFWNIAPMLRRILKIVILPSETSVFRLHGAMSQKMATKCFNFRCGWNRWLFQSELEVTHSSETSVNMRATRLYIPEDGIKILLPSVRLNSMILAVWDLPCY